MSDGKGLQAFGHGHPIRAEILRLVAEDKSQSLAPDDLRPKLDGEPEDEVIRYHLAVLRSVGLLPDT